MASAVTQTTLLPKGMSGQRHIFLPNHQLIKNISQSCKTARVRYLIGDRVSQSLEYVD